MQNKLATLVARYHEQLEELRPFDCNVWLGKPSGFSLAEELPPDKLIETLNAYKIRGALVSHWRSRNISAQDGNDALSACRFDNDKMFLIWTALPLLKGELRPLPQEENLCRRVKAVRVFPKAHNFPLKPWCIGSLCEWLIEHNLPLFVWHTETVWQDIYELAKAFGKLQIVIETQNQKILYHTRPLFSLLGECPNIMVETSNLVGQGFLEYLVREYGARRLLFGSFLPINDPLVGIGMIVGADLSDREKHQIAHENIEMLIAGVTL